MRDIKFSGLGLLIAAFAMVSLLTGCQGLQPGSGGTSPAPTASLIANPTTVNAGQTVTLTWQTANATTVSIDGIGTVMASGTQTVTPTATTTYRLIATGAGGTLDATAMVTVKAVPVTSINSINHVIFMLQENRSFDSYFGNLPQYWQANGITAQQFDGLPPNTSNPSFDGTTTINSFHLKSVCFSDLSPSWNESHVDWNRNAPTSATPTMDGYAFNAAKYARNNSNDDIEGLRAMGYYTGDDLNFYYDMATKFATSDRWFSPVMSRTPPNREYLLAATSAGHVYPVGSLPNKTIFQALEEAGVSWKVYESDPNTSYLRGFQPFADQHADKIVDAAQFAQDAASGNLPAVALIDGGYASGRDEHPNNNIQTGAQYVEGFVKALMGSPSWQDSVFFLTFDEGGGTYDHVPPQPAVNPEGCTDTSTTACGPIDLQPGDICSNAGTNCSFNFTGFRIPLVVISPFAKKNYVSHTVADTTAILKFIETRFNIQPLTQRDAAQIDMQEFFSFPDPAPWATPPTPVDQVTGATCNFDALQ